MELTGETRIPASREQVWAALNNPNVLRKCIPSCQSMEKKSPTEMEAVVKVKVGPISASFKTDVTLSNVNPPESYTITTEGQGGIAGFAKGVSDVHLREENGETVVAYKVDVKIGGRIAMLGSKFIESASHKLARQFFERLNKIVTKKAEAQAQA